MPDKKLTLAKALRLAHIPPPRVAFVGAGGKTTALFQVARELAPFSGSLRGLIRPGLIAKKGTSKLATSTHATIPATAR